jgi:hypothetical protein
MPSKHLSLSWCLVRFVLFVLSIIAWLHILVQCCNVRTLKPCWWFSPGTPVSSTKNTDRHNITEILLKVALNTITLTPPPYKEYWRRPDHRVNNVRTLQHWTNMWSHAIMDNTNNNFSYIVAVSVFGGGNRSTRRKPPTRFPYKLMFVLFNVKRRVPLVNRNCLHVRRTRFIEGFLLFYH